MRSIAAERQNPYGQRADVRDIGRHQQRKSIMARTKVPLALRWQAIHEQEAARKFKQKRQYKTQWENAKNRRIWKADDEANAADYRAVLDATLKERQAFELKYADVSLVKHMSPIKIKKLLPKPKEPRKLIARVSRRLDPNRDAINAKRREQYRIKKESQK
jgi:hypothetical protein